MSRIAVGLSIALCSAFSGSCDRGRTPQGIALRPGDSLFDHLPRMEAELDVASCLLPERNVDTVPLLKGEACVVSSQDWTEGDPPEAFAVGAEMRLWSVVPTAPFDLDAEALWIEHDGARAVRETRERAKSGGPYDRTIWRDGERAVFWWNTASGRLLALARARPESVTFGFEFPAESPLGALSRLFRFDGDMSPAANELTLRLTLNRVTRTSLFAPAPSSFSIAVDEWNADRLQVDFRILDLRSDLFGETDGVSFAIDVVTSSGSERVFQRFVRDAGFSFEAEVDLSSFRGRRFGLRLMTHPGPTKSALGDLAVWSGLRVYGRPTRPVESPHVFLIDIDTLRADRMSCYGYERQTTPGIDAWARDHAVVYEDSMSSDTWTLPSTASMLTGLSPTQHGVRTSDRSISSALCPIAQRLAESGYETYARTDGGFVGVSFGFDVGFDVYDTRSTDREDWNWDDVLAHLRSRSSDRPVFYFLQTYRTHAPYSDDRLFEESTTAYDGPYVASTPERTDGIRLDEADWRYLNDVYDAGIRRMDEVVGDFLAELEVLFEGAPLLVILTSDHGEELGDGGRFGHGHSLRREMLAVPLIVRHPGGDKTGRSEQPVSGLDIVPTILDYAGLPAEAHLSGRSLAEPLPNSRVRVAELGAPNSRSQAWAIQYDGWKLLHGEINGYGGPTDYPDLFSCQSDQEERVDLHGQSPEVAERLAQTLQKYLEQYPSLGVTAGGKRMDSGVAAELRALGYLGEE